MLKLEPDVNIIDEVTGQTLLEFAIRKDNVELLKVRFRTREARLSFPLTLFTSVCLISMPTETLPVVERMTSLLKITMIQSQLCSMQSYTTTMKQLRRCWHIQPKVKKSIGCSRMSLAAMSSCDVCNALAPIHTRMTVSCNS